MEVSKADLEKANLSIRLLKEEIEHWKLACQQYEKINQSLLERWQGALVQIENLQQIRNVV